MIVLRNELPTLKHISWDKSKLKYNYRGRGATLKKGGSGGGGGGGAD